MGIFQSTHPLRGATPKIAAMAAAYEISIHAPLAGCDKERRDHQAAERKFQSTHPLRGATLLLMVRLIILGFQSTHPLRGATYHPANEMLQ